MNHAEHFAQKPRYILTLTCADAPGIVAAVAGFVTNQGGFIIESAQFGDASTNRFFARMDFALDRDDRLEPFRSGFAQQVAARFDMQWDISEKSYRPKLLIMVSKFGHCLNDLLHRYRTGTLAVEIPAIVSNHADLRQEAEWHNIPFYHLPVERGGREQQEARVLEIMEQHGIELVALARYMQILSDGFCRQLQGRAINIHHSFLPSFKGGRPYHQAHDRGVKLIGATAHYVTPELDEGPIIEQEVERVDHTYSPAQLAAVGRDIECRVFARALTYHIERRVLLNGHKTVVFK